MFIFVHAFWRQLKHAFASTKAQRDRYNENKEYILHERRLVASNVKARERYQANSDQKRADERQQYRRDPEANRARKRASRHPILIFIFPCINMYTSFLLLPGSYDDDPSLVPRPTSQLRMDYITATRIVGLVSSCTNFCPVAPECWSDQSDLRYAYSSYQSKLSDISYGGKDRDG